MTWSLDVRTTDTRADSAILELSPYGDVLFFFYGSREFQEKLERLWAVWRASLCDRLPTITSACVATAPSPARIDFARLRAFDDTVQTVLGWSWSLRWNSLDEFQLLNEAQTAFDAKYPLTAAWHEAAKQKESDVGSNTIWGPLFPDTSLTVTGAGAGVVMTSEYTQLQTEPAHGVGPFTAVPYGVMFALYQTPGVARRVEVPVLHVDAEGWAQVMSDAGQLIDADDHVIVRGEQTYSFERIEHRAPR